MAQFVCPWWGGYFIDNPFRRILHRPDKILAPYVEPGMRVLDFGCGMGLFSIAAARLVGDSGTVVAADLQPRMLATLQKRARRAGVAQRIRTHLCEPHAVGAAGPFEFVLAFWSAHEVPNLRSLLDEFRECLVLGGTLLLAEPKGHVTQQAFDETVHVARDVGFEPVERPRIALSRAIAFAKD